MSALALAQPALPALAPVVIDRYAGPYAWLSNGAPSPVQLGRFTCATVEHGFNAAKTLDMAQRAWVIAAPAPFGAGPDRERSSQADGITDTPRRPPPRPSARPTEMTGLRPIGTREARPSRSRPSRSLAR